MAGYRLMLTTSDGSMIDEWNMDDDVDRDIFYELAEAKFISDFTANEIKAQLKTYPD